MYALMSSGGKDSTLALDRALRSGLDVQVLANIYDGASQRVAFHGVRKELIAAQASALGLDAVMMETGDVTFEQVFEHLLGRLREIGVTGIVFGNIHLADVRAWYEDRVTAAGFRHIEPLWGDPPKTLLEEFVDRGFQAVIVSVDLQQGGATLLGRSIDQFFMKDAEALEDLDLCGERGEYHSFVYGGPLFQHSVPVTPGKLREEKNHRLLDLLPHL